MVCLDTDILVSFLRGDKKAIEKVALLRQNGESPLRTTIISNYELTKGAKQSETAEKNQLQVRRLIAELEVLALDQEACESGANVFNQLKERGSMVNELDVLIAGIVLSNKEKLVSRDKGFKRIPELKLDEW